jgi:hypothetical protein
MSKFSDWLNIEVDKMGGPTALQAAAPQVLPTSLAKWLFGLGIPSYQAQWYLSKALKVEFREIRKQIGVAHTEFAECLSRHILAKGRFSDFAETTGMKKSTLDKWLNQGVLPQSGAYGQDSAPVRQICLALILWDPTLNPKVLTKEVELALAKDYAARSDARTQAEWAANDCSKISIPCNLSKSA